MKVINQYKNHHYVSSFTKTQCFCPSCGNKTVWEEDGSGDYYVGCTNLCTSCGVDFTIQGPHMAEEDNVKGMLEQLRSGITAVPKKYEK